MSAGRGKYAESKVQAFLTKYKAEHAAMSFNRILDAHSAKGAMSNPQPGDFQWFMDSGYKVQIGGAPEFHSLTFNGLIEVKSTEHKFRLPYKNFGPDQVGRMVIRQLAGSMCIVLICHHVAGERGAMWRNVPLDFFRERPATAGSWDLTEFTPVNDLSVIMKEYLSE